MRGQVRQLVDRYGLGPVLEALAAVCREYAAEKQRTPSADIPALDVRIVLGTPSREGVPNE